MTSPMESPQVTTHEEVDGYLSRATHLLEDEQSFMEARFILHKLGVTNRVLCVELRQYTRQKLANQFPGRRFYVMIIPRVSNCAMIIWPKG